MKKPGLDPQHLAQLEQSLRESNSQQPRGSKAQREDNAMPRTKIVFETNKPLELALQFGEGKLSPSTFGDPQYMFSTTDNRVFYVADKVAAKIHALKLSPGEVFEFGRAEVDYGNNRKGIEWKAARVGADAPTPAPVKTAVITMPSSSSNTNNTGNGSTNGPNPINGHGTNGNNGHVPPAQQPLPAWGLFLLGQTCALTDVFALACKHASEHHGNLVRPEDVRALMLSSFINISKNGSANVT